MNVTSRKLNGFFFQQTIHYGLAQSLVLVRSTFDFSHAIIDLLKSKPEETGSLALRERF